MYSEVTTVEMICLRFALIYTTGIDQWFSVQCDFSPRKHLATSDGDFWASPCGSVVKESTCSAGGPCSTPGSGRFPGEGNGNPLQYSCLENPMDRGAWHATLHGISKGRTRLSDLTTEADFGHHN